MGERALPDRVAPQFAQRGGVALGKVDHMDVVTHARACARQEQGMHARSRIAAFLMTGQHPLFT
eukprot:2782429-Pleurochrysis_carterae.AAC.1